MKRTAGVDVFERYTRPALEHHRFGRGFGICSNPETTVMTAMTTARPPLSLAATVASPSSCVFQRDNHMTLAEIMITPDRMDELIEASGVGGDLMSSGDLEILEHERRDEDGMMMGRDAGIRFNFCAEQHEPFVGGECLEDISGMELCARGETRSSFIDEYFRPNRRSASASVGFSKSGGSSGKVAASCEPMMETIDSLCQFCPPSKASAGAAAADSDTIDFHRCSFCSKVFCTKSLGDCGGICSRCSESFCKFCSNKSYLGQYEELVCFDCNRFG
jgi:hypothetical protein